MHLTDYTLSNILIQIADSDAWSEQEIFHKLGQPNKDKVFTITGQDIDPSAPAHLIEPVVISSIDLQWLRDELLVVDLGQSFFYGKPPANGVGTPLSYRAPEAIFDQQASFWSDIWALSCIIFEIRLGTPLFESDFKGPPRWCGKWSKLGKLPEPWWNAWEQRYAYFDDHRKPKQQWAQGIPLAVEYPLVEQLKDISTENGELGDDEDDGDEKTLKDEEDRLMESMGTKISSEEVDLLEDLLARIFKHIPNQRLTLENITSHRWFCQ